MTIFCSSSGCNNAVTGNLACPFCKKLGIENFFCSQECFKDNYNEHKKVHAVAKKVLAAKQKQQQPLTTDGVTCSLDLPDEVKRSLPEWAKGFHFRGVSTVRPTLLSPKREIPPSIRRPDYANHPDGMNWTVNTGCGMPAKWVEKFLIVPAKLYELV